jgi:hypothetical protein
MAGFIAYHGAVCYIVLYVIANESTSDMIIFQKIQAV